MDLENRIMKSVTEYLESDKIETVVNEAMDKAVEELFNSYRGLGSVIKKTLEEQMTPIIESHDYSEFTLKLDHVLKSVLKEQARETNKGIWGDSKKETIINEQEKKETSFWQDLSPKAYFVGSLVLILLLVGIFNYLKR